jgi:membrane protein required for colicin V production
MVIDILLLLFVLAGFWLGYVRGIIRSLLMVVAYIAALLLTLKISPWFSEFLSSTLPMGKMFALIFGTIGLLLVFIFFIHFIAKRVNTSFKKGNLTKPNKIIGGIIMTCLAVLFFSLLLWPVNQFGWIGDKSKETSITYSTLVSIPDKSRTFIQKFKPLFSRYWQLMEQTIEESKSD